MSVTYIYFSHYSPLTLSISLPFYFILYFVFSSSVEYLGEHGIRSNYGTLTVLKSPDAPKILQGDYMVTTDDREIELECVSENGKPAAEVLNCINCLRRICIIISLYSHIHPHTHTHTSAKRSPALDCLGK